MEGYCEAAPYPAIWHMEGYHETVLCPAIWNMAGYSAAVSWQLGRAVEFLWRLALGR